MICLEGKVIICPEGFYCVDGTAHDSTDPECGNRTDITESNNPENCPIPCLIGNYCKKGSAVPTIW